MMIGISVLGLFSPDGPMICEKMLEIESMLTTCKDVHGGSSPPMQAQSLLLYNNNPTYFTLGNLGGFSGVCQLAFFTPLNDARRVVSVNCPLSAARPPPPGYVVVAS